MICPICNYERIYFVKEFKPYVDLQWSFNIYDCTCCSTRFAERDASIQYHNFIHERQEVGSYSFHYHIANQVKKFIVNKEIDKCEAYLRSLGSKFSHLIDFVLKQPTDKTILELGCSTGFLSAFLRSKGYTIYGMDISIHAIDFAQNCFGSFYGNSDCFNNVLFDVIIHGGVIGCVDNPKLFLQMYIDKLNKGGQMYFNSPNLTSVKLLSETWTSTPPPDLIFLFSPKSFDYLLDKNLLDFNIQEEINYQNSALKQLLKWKNGRVNYYPRRFFTDDTDSYFSEKSCCLKKIVKNGIKTFIGRLFQIIGLKVIPEDYGLYVHITKR